MAFTERFLKNTLWSDFSFFETGDPDAAGPFAVDMTHDGAFKLTEIRCVFSGVCSNDIYLRCYISSVEGATYTIMFLSYALSASTFYRWQASAPAGMLCQSGDTVQISCVTDNTWSCNVLGQVVAAVG